MLNFAFHVCSVALHQAGTWAKVCLGVRQILLRQWRRCFLLQPAATVESPPVLAAWCHDQLLGLQHPGTAHVKDIRRYSKVTKCHKSSSKFSMSIEFESFK